MSRMLTAAGLLLAATALTAQAPAPLKPGDQIPDLALTGATRGGVLQRPVRLSDLRDHTLVIAFFYKARTSG
ncbi:MAG TPA: hypothetical protein PKA50_15985 [Gemmatimonadales bacterium]|nr:hypothetical protein [Gemmatimonadales bacterium]